MALPPRLASPPRFFDEDELVEQPHAFLPTPPPPAPLIHLSHWIVEWKCNSSSWYVKGRVITPDNDAVNSSKIFTVVRRLGWKRIVVMMEQQQAEVELVGDMDMDTAMENLPMNVLCAFVKGFPSNWNELRGDMMNPTDQQPPPRRAPPRKATKTVCYDEDELLLRQVRERDHMDKIKRHVCVDLDDCEDDIPAVSNEVKLAWPTEHVDALRAAILLEDPRQVDFWSRVAAKLSPMVHYSPEECHEAWLSLSSSRATTTSGAEIKPVAKPPSKPSFARVGTAKFRREIREAWISMQGEDTFKDDLLSATPFRGSSGAANQTNHSVKVKRSWVSRVETPGATFEFGTNQHHRSVIVDDVTSPDILNKIDKSAFDEYVVRFVRREKKRKRRDGTATTTRIEPVSTRKRKLVLNRDGFRSGVTEQETLGGVTGSFTPGGSVKIVVDKDLIVEEEDDGDDDADADEE